MSDFIYRINCGTKAHFVAMRIAALLNRPVDTVVDWSDESERLTVTAVDVEDSTKYDSSLTFVGASE